MILPVFPAYLCYCELLWQNFPRVLLKLQLYQFRSNIPSPSCTSTRRSRTEILWAQGALPHVSLYANTTFIYSLFENKRTIFTKF
jgi:hypothetical protein